MVAAVGPVLPAGQALPLQQHQHQQPLLLLDGDAGGGGAGGDDGNGNGGAGGRVGVRGGGGGTSPFIAALSCAVVVIFKSRDFFGSLYDQKPYYFQAARQVPDYLDNGYLLIP